MMRRGTRALVALVGMGAAAGCGADDGIARGVSVDTLANGAVRVRSPEAGLWEEGAAWRLVEDLRLGSVDGAGPEAFERVQEVEADAAGRIFVLDAGAREVRVFDAAGEHVTTFGGRGDGPGEFQSPGGLALDGQGNVWVVDGRHNRYSVFAPTGELVREMPRHTRGQVFPWPGAVLSDGRVVEVEMTFTDDGAEYSYPVFDAGGTALGALTLPEFQPPTIEIVFDGGGRALYGIPFAPALEHAWDPAGGAWLGISERYELARVDLETGDTTVVLERPWTPVPVAAIERERAIQGMASVQEQGGDFDPAMLPATHPAFLAIHPSRDGSLWVEVPHPPPAGMAADELMLAPPAFDVFDPDGRYLGEVASPVPLRSPAITGTHVYGISRDTMGVGYVVRLRIEGKDPG